MSPPKPRRNRIHFWGDDQFESLKDLADEAAKSPEWSDYAAFCTDYERGLRPQAFATLERFVSSFEHAPFAERRTFVSWLLSRVDGRAGSSKLIPQPLNLRIVEPTLREWTEVEPACGEPHRWLGGYEHLKRALELDPDDAIARRKLVVWIVRRVGFSIHELPIGYLGVPAEDLVALREAEALLPRLLSNEDRCEFAALIAEDREKIQTYLRERPL